MTTEYLSQSTLLYVEDDPIIRNVLERRLRNKVKKLYIAVDGKDGYEQYCEHQPDIILTDITMPRLNGIEMSRQIKEINKDIPIIIMSAHSDTSYLLESIEIGIDGYLLKPIDKEKLFNVLESNIKTKFLEREIICRKRELLHQSRFALLGEMLSVIAHQWRQPLNIISMISTNVRIKLDIKQEKEDISDVISNELIKMEQYIQNLSSLIDGSAKFYKPSSQLDIVVFNEIIPMAIDAFKDALTSEKITLTIENNSTKSVRIFINEFVQICLHLLYNSYENIIEKKVSNPQIIIVTNDYEDGVVMTISDNAGGIPDEIIDKIFDPYFSTKYGKNGNGLGLYISKLVIEEHLRGKITVENENDGVKFVIQLRDI